MVRLCSDNVTCFKCHKSGRWLRDFRHQGWDRQHREDHRTNRNMQQNKITRTNNNEDCLERKFPRQKKGVNSSFENNRLWNATDRFESGLYILLNCAASEHVVNNVYIKRKVNQSLDLHVELANGSTVESRHSGDLKVEMGANTMLPTEAYCKPSCKLNLLSDRRFEDFGSTRKALRQMHTIQQSQW